MLEDKRKQRNNKEDKVWYSFPVQENNCRQGDCRQYYYNGKCSRGDRPWKHERTQGKGKGGKLKGKGKDKGGKGDFKGGKGKDKGKGKGKNKGKDRGRSDHRDDHSRGRSSTREISQPRRGVSPSGRPNMRICYFYTKHKCNSEKDCGFWHPPTCT